jgi:hypothetical protein
MDKSGTWCRRHCRVGDIIKFDNDGCGNLVHLLVAPVFISRLISVFFVRFLGVFNSKPDLSSLQTGILAGATGSVSTAVRTGTGTSTGGSENEGTNVDPPPNPKLGLAPLSSEWAFFGV